MENKDAGAGTGRGRGAEGVDGVRCLPTSAAVDKQQAEAPRGDDVMVNGACDVVTSDVRFESRINFESQCSRRE